MKNNKSLWRIILSAGLWVGTFDITAAIILNWVKDGSTMKLFQYIASGVFGSDAFSGGLTFVFLGLIFHYLITFIWTILFFRFYPKVRKRIKNNIHIGLAYGFIIWSIMNHIILPLSNVPQGPFNITSMITGILILIAAIGLPLSYMANKYYYGGQRNPQDQNK